MLFHDLTIGRNEFETVSLRECREFNQVMTVKHQPYVNWVRTRHGRKIGVVVGYVDANLQDNMMIGWSMCSPKDGPLYDKAGNPVINLKTGEQRIGRDRFERDRALYIAFKRAVPVLETDMLSNPYAWAHSKAVPVIKDMLIRIFTRKINRLPSSPVQKSEEVHT